MIYKTVPQLLVSIQLLEYFDIVKDNTIELQLESTNGNTQRQLITIERMTNENKLTLDLKHIPYYLQNERAYFWETYIKESGIYYIQYNKCSGKEVEQKYGDPKKAKKLPSFVKFKNKVLATIKQNHVKKIIFDMRFNGGGNSSQGTEFIKKLSHFYNINQNKKLYVIIGKSTFSSAILNTLDFKYYTNATIVGEATSGKPNHYGQVKHFYLPQSNLKVFYSTKYFKRTQTATETIKPDVEIETRFSEFINGIDPVYEWITKQ